MYFKYRLIPHTQFQLLLQTSFFKEITSTVEEQSPWNSQWCVTIDCSYKKKKQQKPTQKPRNSPGNRKHACKYNTIQCCSWKVGTGSILKTFFWILTCGRGEGVGHTRPWASQLETGLSPTHVSSQHTQSWLRWKIAMMVPIPDVNCSFLSGPSN